MDDEIARAADAKKGTPFLTTDQVARYVGLTRQTLERMRRKGGGPPYRKHGGYVRYHIDDVIAWSAARTRTSTHGGLAPSPMVANAREGGDRD